MPVAVTRTRVPSKLPVIQEDGEEHPRQSRYRRSDFVLRRALSPRVHTAQSKINGRLYVMQILPYHPTSVTIPSLPPSSECPFIVYVWGMFAHYTNTYVIRDYIPGPTIFQLLSKAERFPSEVAKFYLAEIACALLTLHTRDIALGDLLPEHLFLNADGHVKVHISISVKDAEKSRTKAKDWHDFGVMMYMFLAGVQTKECWPAVISEEAKDLIVKLRDKNPYSGLLSAADISETENGNYQWVRSHRWFSVVDWDRLEAGNYAPPYIPQDHGYAKEDQ